MVTGLFLPEINGAVLQCKNLMNSMVNEVEFKVLTGSVSRVRIQESWGHGIEISRIGAGDSGVFFKSLFMGLFLIKFALLVRGIEIVHVHGFSVRNALLVLVARLMRKRIVLKMTSFGQDDPISVQRQSKLQWMVYRLVDDYIAVSPSFVTAARTAGIEPSRCHLIPNAVDIEKFCSASVSDRKSIRRSLGFGDDEKVFLFIGHFSPEKRPMMIYDAWRALVAEGYNCRLTLIGKTSGGYEIDSNLAPQMNSDANLRGLSGKLTIIEFTEAISDFMKAADVFVHPSVREGLPNVVLEAMASSLPCIVTRLPGVTDSLIRDGETGLLIEKDDLNALSDRLKLLLTDRELGRRLGRNARALVMASYGIQEVSNATRRVYFTSTDR